MTEQVSLKKGLKYFRNKSGADAVVTKTSHFNYLDAIKPVDKKDLITHEQKHHALSYLMYLKQK